MKLPTSIALVSLFWAGSIATITLEDLPSQLKAGSTYEVKWTQDRDYQVKDFYLTHEEHGGESWSMVSVVDHYLNITKGDHSVAWEVPRVKNNGNYQLWIQGFENANISVPEGQTGYGATTNSFEIVGGPTLYSKEIAGVVIGTLVGLLLLLGIFAAGARFWRKRQSLAVDLSESDERGYTDSGAGTRR